MAAISAIAAAVISTVGVAVSVEANADAAEDQQRIQEASNFEARQTATRRKVRERRIAEARLRQSAANTGVGGSSGEAGAISSIATQFASAGSATMFAQQQGDRMGQVRSDLAKGQAVGSIIQAGGGLVGSANEAGLFE